MRCQEAANRDRNRLRHDLFTAWHAGYFGRVKRMPSLENILKKLDNTREPRRQSPEEILRVVELINSHFGGKDRRKRNRKKEH